MLTTRTQKQNDLLQDEPTLDISSLIDVCFLLLIYFLVTTTIQPRELDLGLDLPSPCLSVERMPLDPLLISIKEDQSIILNENLTPELLDTGSAPRSLPLLEERLRLFAASSLGHSETPLIQINAHDQSEQQRVIDVLNLLTKLEIKSITFTDIVN